MRGYSQNSGPVYSNVSLIKRSLFQSNTGLLPSHEIVLYLVKHWNNKSLEEAEKLVNYALYAKSSFFAEDADTGLWAIKKHIDQNLDNVYNFMSGQNCPFTAKELSKKLKFKEISYLISGLSFDLRFSVFNSNGEDYWILSEWELANDVVYNHLQTCRLEFLSLASIFDILVSEYGMNIDRMVFAPEIDRRFTLENGVIYVDEITAHTDEGSAILPEIMEEVARAGILVCKYIEKNIKLSAAQIVNNIFGIKAYERHFEMYCRSVTQFLSSLNGFTTTDTGEWYATVMDQEPDIVQVPYWNYSVKGSQPVIGNYHEIMSDSPKKDNSGIFISENNDSKNRRQSKTYLHYLTYFERVKGYIAVPAEWQQKLESYDQTSLIVNSDGYRYTWSYSRGNKRSYLFGNGVMDFLSDYSILPGQRLTMGLSDDFEMQVQVGNVDEAHASDQARLLDIGKLVEESRSINKSYFSILVEVMATYPSGIHSTLLFDRVNAIRPASRSTMHSLLSSNSCFFPVGGKKGYWKIDISKISRCYVDEQGAEAEVEIDQMQTESMLTRNNDKIQSPVKRKSRQYIGFPELWDEFSRWSKRQPSFSYEKLVANARNKQELIDLIVQSYSKLVCKLANHKRTYYMDRMDVVQEGVIGLLRAIDLYDPNGAVSFGNYAKYHVLSRMIRKQADNQTLIRFPAHAHEKILHFERKMNEKAFVEGVWPTYLSMPDDNSNTPSAEMYRQTTLRNIDYISFEQYWGRVKELPSDFFYFPWQVAPVLDSKSLKSYFDEKDLETINNELSLICDIEESDAEIFWNNETVEGIVMLKELGEKIECCLSHLSEREETVIRLRFGLDDGRERTLEEVCKRIGFSRQGIRNIEQRALIKLRKHLKPLSFEEYLPCP